MNRIMIVKIGLLILSFLLSLYALWIQFDIHDGTATSYLGNYPINRFRGIGLYMEGLPAIILATILRIISLRRSSHFVLKNFIDIIIWFSWCIALIGLLVECKYVLVECRYEGLTGFSLLGSISIICRMVILLFPMIGIITVFVLLTKLLKKIIKIKSIQ